MCRILLFEISFRLNSSFLLFGFCFRFLHQCDEFCKQVIAVGADRGCFGVILNAKKWQLLMLKTLDGVVVKVNMSQLDFELAPPSRVFT